MAQLQSTSITGSLIVTGGITGSISGSIIAPGSTTQVLYNNGGVVAGSSGFVYSGSNVGIGTSSPFNKLTVGSIPASGYGLITISSDWASGTAISTGIKIGAANDTGGAGVDIRSHSNYAASSGTEMSFWTNSTGNVLSEYMRITNSGNVGIGTSSPSTALTVARAASTAPVLTLLTTDSTSNGFISWKNSSGTQNAAIGTNYGVSDTGAIEFISGSVTNMILRSNGNLLVGTTTSTYATSNRGVIQVNGNSTAIFGLTTGGTDSGYLFHTGTDMLVWNTKAGYTAFGTNNTEKARINSNGTLIVGSTVAPDETYWKGTAVFGNDGENKVIIGQLRNTTITGAMIGGHNSALTSWANLNLMGGDVFIGAAQSIYLTVKSDGNVGIGTTSPSYKLQVAGTSLFANEQTISYTNAIQSMYGGTGYSLFRMYGNSNGVEMQIDAHSHNSGAATIGTYTNSDVFIKTNQTNRMVVKAAGNVGIGTDSPGALLQVGYQNTTSDDLIRLGISYNTSRSARGGITWHDSGNTTGKIYTEYDGSQVSMVFGSLYNSGYNSNQLMVIRGNGNVGIGTTSPASLLHINGSGNTFTRYTNTSNSGHYIDIGANGAGESFVYGYGAYPLLFGTNGSERMRITSGGNIGIGTTSPSAKFHVVGNQSILSNYGVGSFQVYNYEISTGTSTSDNQTFSLYLGRFGNGYHKLIFWGSGYGTDTGASIEMTTDWGSSVAPKITTSTGLSIGAATFTIHYVRVDYGSYDLFIKYTAGMPTGYANTINYDIISNTGTGYTQFTYASGVTVPTLNSSNLVASITAFDYDTGRVGIGVTSPSYKLEVDGTFGIGGDATFNGTNTYINSSYIYVGNNNYDLVSISGNTMYFPGDGKVGIGTTSPSSKLHVTDTSNPTINIGTLNGNTGNAGIQFYSGTGGSNNGFLLQYIKNSSTDRFGFIDGGSVERLTILNGGNVGINTTAPQKPLDVVVSSNNFSTAGAAQISVGAWAGIHFGYRENNTNYRKSAIVFERTDNAGGGSNAAGKVHILNGPATGAGSATLADSKLTIAENGNVGIGTTSPSQLLHVSGGNAIIRNAFIGVISAYGTSYASFSHISRSGADDYSFLSGDVGDTYVNANNGYSIHFRQANADKMVIVSSGNVGIGTTTPEAKLQVSGSISGSSINFGQDTLNYYDVEDTWYPEIDTSNNDIVGVNYATQEGTYTRIGDVVHAWFYISVANMANAGTGTAIIKTLPFTSGTQVTWFSSLITVDASLILPGPAGTQLKGYVAGASTDITLHLDDSGANGFGFRQDAGWRDSGGVISGYVVYKAQ